MEEPEELEGLGEIEALEERDQVEELAELEEVEDLRSAGPPLWGCRQAAISRSSSSKMSGVSATESRSTKVRES